MVGATTAGLLAIGLSVAVVAPAHADDTTPGTYNTLEPERVLDTRSGIGAAEASIPPLGTITFHIPDQLSSRIGSVLLEVTVVNPTAAGYATVYQAGSPRPVVSNINFQLGQNVPNMVVAQVTSDYNVSIFNGSHGRIDLLADVQGYFHKGANQGDPGTLVPLTPTRLLDTRSGLGAGVKAQVKPMSVTKLQVAGRAGVPADAKAVAINVTAVGSTGGGFITAYPGDPRPVSSTVNFEAGANRANLALAEIGTDGTISLYNGSRYPVDLLADVTGYFVGGGSSAVDGSYTPSSTVRVFDSRDQGGVPLPSLATARVPVFPPNDPFATYIKAVAINVTAVNPQASGFLTTWDGNGSVPAVSNVNFRTYHNAAGSIIVPVNDDGTISIRNGSFGSVDLVIDLDGLFFALPEPTLAAGRTSAAPSAAALLAKAQSFLAVAHQPTITAGR